MRTILPSGLGAAVLVVAACSSPSDAGGFGISDDSGSETASSEGGSSAAPIAGSSSGPKPDSGSPAGSSSGSSWGSSSRSSGSSSGSSSSSTGSSSGSSSSSTGSSSGSSSGSTGSFSGSSSGSPGSSSGSGIGDASAACGVLPVNPNATQQAKKLLCYLYSQYGTHVLSGQQETSWASNPDVDTNYIYTNTRKYPVIRGADYLYPNGTTTRAQAWWNAGGIPMVCYHMGAPPLSDTFANSQTAAPSGINAVLTPGTASYSSFLQKLDYAAGELQKLQAANVAVLWRPFHEAGGTWFWWSKEGGAQYVRLWSFMYDYFTNTKGLNNLIWLHPYDGSPQSAFYPGKAYVDVGGADTYANNQPFAPMFATTRAIVGTTIPVALHENGAMPDPSSMFTGSAAPWVLFNTWAGYETSANSLSFLQGVYANANTVTRDKVPNLK